MQDAESQMLSVEKSTLRNFYTVIRKYNKSIFVCLFSCFLGCFCVATRTTFHELQHLLVVILLVPMVTAPQVLTVRMRLPIKAAENQRKKKVQKQIARIQSPL